jgi:hypothetical protein
VAKLKSEPSNSQWVRLDGAFVRREVGNAVSTFVAPFRGAANAMIEASRSGEFVKVDPTRGRGDGGKNFTRVYRADEPEVGAAHRASPHRGPKKSDN